MSGTATQTETGIPAALEHKAIVASPESGLINADAVTGVVEALVSITGIEDEVKDTIEPGAYADSISQRTPKGIFAHDWGRWVARTEEAKELMPGDPLLPKTQRNGQPWPAGAGGLYVKARFNLATDEGRNSFENVRFFSETGECEWSVGYQVPKGGSTRTRDGGRHITKMAWYEYSPVLFGAAPLTGTLSVKSADGSGGRGTGAPVYAEPVVIDGDGAAAPDPVTAMADSGDPDIAALHEQALREMDAQTDGWDAIDAAAAIDPREEDLDQAEGDAEPDADDTGKPAAKPEASAKVVLDGGATLEFKDTGTGGTQESGSSITVSASPWSDFTPADYTPAQWHKACLIHDHPTGQAVDGKESCKLPCREPDGTLNKNGVHAAAGALAGARSDLQATPAQKAKAAAALRGLYKTIGDDPPESLQESKTAGVEVTPADVKATDRLKAWYTHGGGAAEIGWGVPGDFMRCVTIAGKHMSPEKAKGFCQLRHKDATGFYAGHAPAEAAGHAAAAAGGKKQLAEGYDPALETGPDAGHMETKTAGTATLPDLPG